MLNSSKSSSIAALPKAVLGILILIVALMVILGNFFPTTYREVAIEDGPIEYLTFFGLCGVVALLAVRFFRLRQNQTWIWKVVTIGSILIFIFGAGEEISWGQRVFGWETSESMQALNTQGETNLHNMKIGGVKLNKVIFTYVFELVLLVYFVVFPLLAKRNKSFQMALAKAGIPTVKPITAIAFIVSLLLVLLIPQHNKWETLEVAVPLVAIAVLLDAFPGQSESDKELHRKGLLPG